jgi:hypothetical protein
MVVTSITINEIPTPTSAFLHFVLKLIPVYEYKKTNLE